jgi:hypothetical protein
MARTVYIIAGDHPQLFAYLRDSLTCDGQVEVILDRRVSERRQTCIPRVPERRQADRRSRPDVDRDLEIRAHAILTLPDNGH